MIWWPLGIGRVGSDRARLLLMSRRNLANSGVESGKPSPVPACGRVYCSCCACVRGSGSKAF